VLIFVDSGDGNLVRDDLAEEAVGHIFVRKTKTLLENLFYLGCAPPSPWPYAAAKAMRSAMAG
jgi:hypothetical protein